MRYPNIIWDIPVLMTYLNISMDIPKLNKNIWVILGSPVDEVWKHYFAVLNFGFLKRIQTPHSLLNFILGFQSR